MSSPMVSAVSYSVDDDDDNYFGGQLWFIYPNVSDTKWGVFKEKSYQLVYSWIKHILGISPQADFISVLLTDDLFCWETCQIANKNISSHRSSSITI